MKLSRNNCALPASEVFEILITKNILRFLFLIIIRRVLFLKSPTVALFLKSKTSPENSCVIFVHGLGRTALSMMIPAIFFKINSYNVFLYDYISGRSGINEHSCQLSDFISSLRKKRFEKISFITHSLGGIILRAYFANFAKDFPNGRTVMLAPPNNGSKTADFFSKIPFLSEILLPLCEIRSIETAFVKSLPPPEFEHAVIAGSRDGKVSPEEAKTRSMKDFLVVNSFHSFIMNRYDVMRAAFNFIQSGKFDPA